MTKKIDFKMLKDSELNKELAQKQEALQKLRFNVAGKAKNHGAKELRQDIARIHTEFKSREVK